VKQDFNSDGFDELAVDLARLTFSITGDVGVTGY